MSRSGPAHSTAQAHRHQHEVVDPRWLLKAIGFTLVGALVCGYITLCLLFYQGQWQLVLHPVRSTKPLTAFAGVPATFIRFDAAESGTPRLTGAWLPADPAARFHAYTILYLRGGDASLAESPADAATIALLHQAGLNLFAFDYRGYGQSDATHPNQTRMSEDARAALVYLENARAISEDRIILFGNGVGASLATALAQAHPALPALILQDPGSSPIEAVRRDPRTRALPVRTLFHEDFSLEPLQSLATPKLLISSGVRSPDAPPAFRAASSPKTTLELDSAASETASREAAAIVRFLDQSLGNRD